MSAIFSISLNSLTHSLSVLHGKERKKDEGYRRNEYVRLSIDILLVYIVKFVSSEMKNTSGTRMDTILYFVLCGS